jgi:hypothetical protein
MVHPIHRNYEQMNWVLIGAILDPLLDEKHQVVFPPRLPKVEETRDYFLTPYREFESSWRDVSAACVDVVQILGME